MALEFGIQPPAWLTRASEEGSDPLRNIRQAQAAANLSETLLQATGMEQQLLSKAQDDRDKALDMQELPKWLREHPKYEDRQNTPWPTPRSRWGEQIIQGWQTQDATSESRAKVIEGHRVALQASAEAMKEKQQQSAAQVNAYTKNVQELGKMGGDTSRFVPKMGKLPTPEDNAELGAALDAQRKIFEAKKDKEKADKLKSSGKVPADIKPLQSRLSKIEQAMDATTRQLEVATAAGDKALITKYRADLIASIGIRNQIQKEIDAKSAAPSPTNAPAAAPAAPAVNPDDPLSLGVYR